MDFNLALQLADASESFLEELYKISDAIHLTDPISADVETIKRQINENKVNNCVFNYGNGYII